MIMLIACYSYSTTINGPAEPNLKSSSALLHGKEWCMSVSLKRFLLRNKIRYGGDTVALEIQPAEAPQKATLYRIESMLPLLKKHCPSSRSH